MKPARLDEELTSSASQGFRGTPEGERASQQYQAERMERLIAAWRADCLEDGRIYARPTGHSE